MSSRSERQNEYRGISKLAAIRVDNIDDSLEVSNLESYLISKFDLVCYSGSVTIPIRVRPQSF